MKPLPLVCLLLMPLLVMAQKETYWVFFSDKNNTSHSVESPETFLSERAIERRARYNVPITEQDLPVSGAYISTVKDLGYDCGRASKWFNTLIVRVDDPAELSSLFALSFVVDTQLLRQKLPEERLMTGNTQLAKTNSGKLSDSETIVPYVEIQNFLGLMHEPLEMLGAMGFYANDLTAKGMHIAVMDSGFPGVDDLRPFNDVLDESWIADRYDFVDSDVDLNTTSDHGTRVLSIMAAFFPEKYVGTAVDATYYLYRTEDASSESPLEEVNWVHAAERADSAGVDLINVSLGYHDFDGTRFDYHQSDLDGKTAIISRAAQIAASKEIIVVNSMGNSGDDDWGLMTPPADAASVVSVGAADVNGLYASFSGRGPTADGRVKPDVMAMGVEMVAVDSNTDFVLLNGTSFAAPLISGLIAAVWQKAREKPASQLIEDLRSTASNSLAEVNDSTGYGLANFALLANDYHTSFQITRSHWLSVLSNLYDDEACISVFSEEEEALGLQLYDIKGRLIGRMEIVTDPFKFQRIDWSILNQLVSGMYIIEACNDRIRKTARFVKH